MNRAASTPNPLSALERLRHWWQRLAAAVFPAPAVRQPTDAAAAPRRAS